MRTALFSTTVTPHRAGRSQQQRHALKHLLGRPLPSLSTCTLGRRGRPTEWRHCSRLFAASGSTSTSTDNKLRVTLDTEELSSSVEFTKREVGERSSTILVSKVKPGSIAEKEGIRAGQRLLAISNPSQPEDLWNLNERPSLRFVIDAVRLTRHDTVTIEVSQEGAAGGASKEVEPSLMDNIVSASQSSDSDASSPGSLLESMEEMIEGDSGKGSKQTIASKLELAYKEDEDAAARERKQIEARKQRRRDYMERESNRDNTKLAAGLAAAFFLPAIGILAWAFSSGLMDRIGSSYRY